MKWVNLLKYPVHNHEIYTMKFPCIIIDSWNLKNHIYLNWEEEKRLQSEKSPLDTLISLGRKQNY
jgi:hypothetical protein